MAGVDPQLYLSDVLVRISNHPKSRIHDLLPRQWKEVFEAEALENRRKQRQEAATPLT